jgi:LPS-assembly protein
MAGQGARIIHNQTEKMMYFEDARLEFFGQPIAYLPFFSTPDPRSSARAAS